MNIRLKSKKFGDLDHDSYVIHELGMLASCELSRVVATCRILRVYHVSYFSSFHTVDNNLSFHCQPKLPAYYERHM